MGRHEIRLRRQRMTSRRIDHHKNFTDVLQEHQRTNRTKRLIKLFLLLAFFIGLMSFLYYVITYTGKRKPQGDATAKTEVIYKEYKANSSNYSVIYKSSEEIRNT